MPVRPARLSLGPDPLALLHTCRHSEAVLRRPLRRGPYGTDRERHSAATSALSGCRRWARGGSGSGACDPWGGEPAVSLADNRGWRGRQPLRVRCLVDNAPFVSFGTHRVQSGVQRGASRQTKLMLYRLQALHSGYRCSSGLETQVLRRRWLRRWQPSRTLLCHLQTTGDGGEA